MSDDGPGMFGVPTGDFHFTLLGWWVRGFWGVTGPTHPERVRWRRFYGYRLLALRLWGVGKGDGRLVGIQWRRL